jgi:hypothetical protein
MREELTRTDDPQRLLGFARRCSTIIGSSLSMSAGFER